MAIPRERTCVLCLLGNRILALEMQDPTTAKRYWSFPGGAIEQGESPEECAIRETLEESGYEIALTSDAFINHYRFRWNGNTYDCTTHWFLAEPLSDQPRPVHDEDYILQSAWLAWPRCRRLFLFNPGMTQALDYWLPLEA